MNKLKFSFLFLLLAIGFSACTEENTEELIDEPSGLTVGAKHQGGKIAYIFVTGDPGYVAGEVHGLIASINDISTSSTWFNGTKTVTGATETTIGAGNSNTSKIISSQGNTGTYAAKLCNDFTIDNYSDWYLPSLDELNKLYINRVAIGGFTNNRYWSSSEYNNGDAFYQNFNDGVKEIYGKDFTYYVRAVRTF